MGLRTVLVWTVLFVGFVKSDKNVKIVIVGAGASGIAAASKLIQNGFKNVTLLEAESYFGGRVHTIPFGDSFIDLGAQWCHGEIGNPSFELANPLNLLEPSTLQKKIHKFAFPNGVTVPLKEGKQQYLLLSNITSDPQLNKVEGAIKEFLVDQYKKTSNQDYMTPELREGYLNYFRNFIRISTAADDWDQENGPGYMAFEEAEGDQMVVWKNGSVMILKVLMKLYPDPSQSLQIEDKIIFNTEVSKINWDDSSDSKVTIETKDGQEFIADRVIFTPSLGVLKDQHVSLFSPPLPDKKKTAIEGLGMGNIGKVLLRFETAFWPADWGQIHILWSDKMLQDLTPEKSWLEGVLGFLTVETQSTTLCAWIGGNKLKAVELIDDKTVTKSLMDLLKSLIPEMVVPEPVEVKRTKWFANPHFKGTYSFRGINATILGVSPRDLEEPLKNSDDQVVVQFAGEATHQTHFSTVHGAIETGWREAQRIIDYYG